jgi:hypothetical protein
MSEETKEAPNPFRPPEAPGPAPAPAPQQLGSLSQEVGFDIPVEAVGLPSKGVIYPPDHPLCNETMVEIKCMTAKEEDLLTSRALIKNGTVISKLLQSCLLNKMVDPDDLLVGDRNAILIGIRVTGYGAEYSAKIQCPECDEQFENEFTLSGLEMRGLGAAPLQPNTNLFEFTLPVTKQVVHFKLLTGAEEAAMSEEEKRRKKIGQQVESSVTSRLVKSVVSIGGETDMAKLVRKITNMPARDSRALRNYMSKIEPGIQMKQFAKCSHCGEQSEVDIPLGISFFWPDLG